MKVLQTLAIGQKVPSELQVMMDHNKELCKKPGIEYEIIEFEGGEQPAAASELFRIKVLEKMRDVLIVDWDVKLKKIPKLLDQISCAFTNGNPYNAILANGSNTRFFRAWRKYIETHSGLKYGGCNRFLQINADKITEFPSDCYSHGFYTLTNIQKERQNVTNDR